MFKYRVAFYLPRSPNEMAVAEALDFPGAVAQGFDPQDARLMIASALKDLAQLLFGRRQTVASASRRCIESRRRFDRTCTVVRLRRDFSEVKRHELPDHLHRHEIALRKICEQLGVPPVVAR